jgi:hypothetical protein
MAFFERGLARIGDRFGELPFRGARVDTAASLYAEDLDLFCRGGLFDLLCTARTSLGEDMLSSWLLHPAGPETITARQAAIVELRALFDLREELANCEGPEVAAVDAGALADWARSTNGGLPGWLRWIAPVLVVATAAAFVRYLLAGSATLLVVAVLIDATITFALQRRTRALFAGAERASRSLTLTAALIERFERATFQAAPLKDLQSAFTVDAGTASQALARLAFLTQMIEHRANYIIRILDAPLLYSVQLAGAVQAWRRSHGPALAEWLRVLAELEALVSLATYSYEHPEDPFPQILSGPSSFEAQQLGHPLIAAAACVRNDVALGGDARLLLVSGSNMSGKSTLLRAVGVNTVLAMAGAPVRAARLRLTPMRVGASIQVHDSLQQGRSRFYAEVLRLRDIVALSDGAAPVLFLLDELFGGTNSSDRLAGAEGIARALISNRAIGMISTHDLALTAIGADALPLRNVHFEDRIEDGQMIFDFKLRDGVVQTRNGLELMRIVGLKV